MKKTEELKELKGKDVKSLFKELQEAEKKMTELRFSASFRKLKNFHEITKERKKIARIWTILTEKAMEKEESKG